MKIVIDCEQLKHPNTGLYTFCIDLSEAMMDIIKEKDRLSFFVGKDKTNFFGDNYKHYRRKLWHKKVPFVFVPGTDIWHTTFQLSKYSGGCFKSKNVVTVHDLNFLYECMPQSAIDKLKRNYQKCLEKADHIVAISNFVKKDIIEHLNVKGKPISVVHNGYRVREFPHHETPIYKPSVPFLYTMGMVNPKKNFKVLPCLLENNNYELVIAGKLIEPVELEYKELIEEVARKYGVSDRIHFLGSIKDEDKYWYLKNCKAFLFPSLAEGFGLPVLEAMHFGKPVFLSNLTSLPEIGGEYAYYFDNFSSDHMQEVFEKSMSQFANNPNRAQELKDYTKRFSYNKAAREYYEIYKSLM